MTEMHLVLAVLASQSAILHPLWPASRNALALVEHLCSNDGFIVVEADIRFCGNGQ